MLRAVLTMIAVAGTMPHALGANLHEVKGSGVPRLDEERCIHSLPALGKRLSRLGLALSKPIECLPVEDEPSAFVPTFEATSAQTWLVETAVTSYQLSLELCQTTLKTLMESVVEKDQTTGPAHEDSIIVDAGCAPLAILDTEDQDRVTEAFQPTVTLLKAL